MLDRRSFLASVLGLSALAIAPPRIFAAQSPSAGVSIDPALTDYLALSPVSIASLDQATPFTFGNAQLQMDALGFQLPFDMSDDEALHNWIEGTYTVTLPSAFRTYALNDQFEELIGFTISQVFSGAEIGEPPNMVSILRGDFDIEQIRATQVAQGYQQLDVDGHQVYSLSEEGDFSLTNAVQALALSKLNNSAMLDDGTLVYTPTLDLMRTMFTPGQTLSEQPWVQQAVAALDLPLMNGMVLGLGALAPGIPAELLQPQSDDEIADFILSMREQEPSPIVLAAIVGTTPGGPLPGISGDPEPLAPGELQAKSKFALVYNSPEEATLAASQIEDRLATGSSLVRKSPWSDMLASWSAVADPELSTVLLTLEWIDMPRTLDLVYSRDTAFITG